MKSWKIQDVVRNQLLHVDKGCLSDPPADLVNIFQRNPSTDITYVARGTNTNERDNLDLGRKILTATHIGIQRAERLITCFFEEGMHKRPYIKLERRIMAFVTRRSYCLAIVMPSLLGTRKQTYHTRYWPPKKPKVM
jgi:hypothetical protein